MPSIFTRIVNGEIPCYKILEDDHYLAFLDIHPINPGHTLVVTKKEIDYIFDVDDELLSGMIIFSKKVAKMIEKAVVCKKVGVIVAGIEVPHCHIHLIPFNEIPELTFSRSTPVSPEELSKMVKKIRGGL